MDGNMQRRNPLRDNSFEVQFGEPSERREIPVEKRKPIIVVFEIEGLPQVWRQLINEAELAMVVTGSDLVEQSRVDLGAERFTGLFFDLERNLEPTTIDIQAEFTLVGKESIGDDVARHFAIEPKNEVAWH